MTKTRLLGAHGAGAQLTRDVTAAPMKGRESSSARSWFARKSASGHSIRD